MPPRTLAIGDIHGCAAALATLLAAVAPARDETIVTIGDYVDHGPDSRGVLAQLIELSTACQLVPLLGNHEEMLLGAWHGRLDHDYWLRFGGAKTLESYGAADICELPPEHIAFCEGLRLFHETAGFLFVHAGYWPNLSLAETPTTAILWEHFDTTQTGPHTSGKIAIVGHTPQRDGRIRDAGYIRFIDTHAYKGGWLSALDVTTGAYWQANERGEVREGLLDARGCGPAAK